MQVRISLLLIPGLLLSLGEPVQFGIFQRRTTIAGPTSTQVPYPQFKFNLFQLTTVKPVPHVTHKYNILKPISSVLYFVDDTLQSVAQLLTGGMRYKPYQRISTTPPPTTTPIVTTVITPKPITSTTSGSTTTTTTTSTTTTVTTISTEAETTTLQPTTTTTITTTPKLTTTKATTTPKPSTTTTTTTTTPKPTTTTTITPKPTTTTQASITEEGKPGNVDWRRINCMSPIRFQGKCSASFAFATAAAIEVHLCSKTGKQSILSPQNLIDCTIAPPFENSGCDGGALEPTFDYVVNVGINIENDYPYAGSVSKCTFKQEKSIGRITDYMSIDEGDEETMEHVLNTIGPITVGIDATHESFRSYTDGIYYERKCRSDIDSLNHAVLLVGYGEETNGEKYWLIRNSYGVNWGDQGYGKIARNVSNHCGIATYAVYPIIS